MRMTATLAHGAVMIGFFEELHNESLDALKSLVFPKKDEFSRTVIALYCSLIEHSWSLLLLAKDGRDAGTAIILRSTLEAHIDIENLLNNPSYLKNLNAAYHKEWLKFLKEGATGTNQYLAGMSSAQNLAVEIARHEACLAKLKVEGFLPLTQLDAFKRAGMEDAYRAVYGRLSRESHNNISALSERHLELSGDGDFNLVIYRDLKPADFEVELDSAAGVLIGSGVRVHQHFGSPATPALEALQSKLFSYRKERDG